MENTEIETKLAAWSVAKQFADNRTITSIGRYSGGIINQTYLVTTSTCQFILQRINPQVFPQPKQIMSNLATLLAHVQKQTHGSFGQQLKFPHLLTCANKTPWFIDTDNSIWRALSFIESTHTLPALGNRREAQQVGFALGQFHRLIQDLNPSSLHDTLPGFHIAPDYLNRYQQLVSTNTQPSSAEREKCHHFIIERQDCFASLEEAKRLNYLQTRPIHGDPKLANILFDQQSEQAVALIDLDTVKPGLIHYDIGDCLRSCCNSAKQSPNTTHSAEFDLELCSAILTGYLQEAGSFLSDYDYQYLFTAIHLIPLELGVRYMTDYLDGNRYFSVDSPEQNLHRAKQQFELTASIERQEVAIRQLIKTLTPR